MALTSLRASGRPLRVSTFKVPPPLLLLLLLLPVCTLLITAAQPPTISGRLVVLVLSQAQDPLSERLTHQLINHLHAQNHQPSPVVHLLHRDFSEPGAWTLLPVLPRLLAQHAHNLTWLVVCEPRTRLRLDRLTLLLAKRDPEAPAWLGHALHDREPTIIHHFALSEQLGYPHLASGLVLSRGLLRSLVSMLEEGHWPQSDFSIDVSHELASLVRDEVGAGMEHSAALCLQAGPGCAAHPEPFSPCGPPTPAEAIFFAVKTCGKFHRTRVPVVLATWAQHAKLLRLFSDTPDGSVPGLVDLGVPNTEQGHCAKTMAIIRHAARHLRRDAAVHWLVIADDDTILSVSRLRELLSCYSGAEPLALGERYGYRARESAGYSYVTGGGGMVLSRAAALTLGAPGGCECPVATAPDDMFLGLCLARLAIPIVHSPAFHQARPVDYAPEYLSAQRPVSFHKHWMIDPLQVYRRWFEEEEQDPEQQQDPRLHLEL